MSTDYVADCSSCDVLCLGGCFTTCANGCAGGCSERCTSTCSERCSDGCSDGCTGDCSGFCSDLCRSSCAIGCYGYCAKNCGSGCVQNCDGLCKSCTGECFVGCHGSARSGAAGAVTCNSGCFSSCDYGCANDCHDECHGECLSSCANQCDMKCDGTCNLACESYCATGCGNNCSGSCTDGCSGCNTECLGSCSTACNTNGCFSQCESNCTGACTQACYENCDNSCGGQCTADCTGGCKTSCTGCGETCGSDCEKGCAVTCTQTCADDCTGTCKGECYTECTTTCKNTCLYTCEGDCDVACTQTCADDCTGTCKGTCENGCVESCLGTCLTSCVGTSSLLSHADAEWLMRQVKIEIYRRSGFDEEGNYLHPEELRNYNGPILEKPDPDLFVLPDDEVIRAHHGAPMIDTLLEICDIEDLRFVRVHDLIPGAYDKESIFDAVSMLRQVDFNDPVSHCRSACTGLCSNGCTTTCQGGCQNACALCSIACSGACLGACTGCSESCGTTCGENCGTGCSGKASACTGCSSGCSGCTGCSSTCTGNCTRGCDATCTGCTAGCSGVSGYNQTCGCGSACVSTCASSSGAIPADVTKSSMTFYHDGRLYGTIALETNSLTTFTAPSFTSIAGATELYWRDADGNTFNRNSTVYYTNSSATYSKYKSLGYKVTKCTSLHSVSSRSLWTVGQYSVGLSFARSTWSQTVKSMITPYSYTVFNDSLVTITAVNLAKEALSGAATADWKVTINGFERSLPLTDILHAGDVINMYGNNITYTVNLHVDESATKTFNVGACYILPYCDCCSFTMSANGAVSRASENPCILNNNPHAYVKHNGTKMTSEVYKSAGTVELWCNEHKEIQTDGDYAGVLYTVGCETYQSDGSETIYGTDGLENYKLYIYNTSGNLIHTGSISRISTTHLRYKFTIPNLGYTISNTTSDSVAGTVKFTPGASYIIHSARSIKLYAR